MLSRLEETLKKDIDRIKSTVIQMGNMVEGAVRGSMHALTELDRQLAYSIILRDRYIDDMEKLLDRLCQEFLVRHQPVGRHLRFVYSVIKIINELERVGDYAESIARHFLTISSIDPRIPYKNIELIAHHSIPMLCSALQAFADENPELAKTTMKAEDQVDKIRWAITDELGQMIEDNKVPSTVFRSLMIIANRFERVADRACNICEEVLYMCTGEDIKHQGEELLEVLFVDLHDACRGQMAKAIGRSLGLERFRFSSGGISPRKIDPRTVRFMSEKGFDISQQTSKNLKEVLRLKDFQIFVSLCREAEDAFPPPPTKMINILWEIGDPSRVEGSEEEVQSAYEKSFRMLESNINDLVEAILGQSRLCEGNLPKKE